jgi:hypothetical protein
MTYRDRLTPPEIDRIRELTDDVAKRYYAESPGTDKPGGRRS